MRDVFKFSAPLLCPPKAEKVQTEEGGGVFAFVSNSATRSNTGGLVGGRFTSKFPLVLRYMRKFSGLSTLWEPVTDTVCQTCGCQRRRCRRRCRLTGAGSDAAFTDKSTTSSVRPSLKAHSQRMTPKHNSQTGLGVLDAAKGLSFTARRWCLNTAPACCTSWEEKGEKSYLRHSAVTRLTPQTGCSAALAPDTVEPPL